MDHLFDVPFFFLLLKQQGHIQEKQKAMNQSPWMKQCCPRRERRVSPFHTPSTGPHQFPPPISTKVKEWGREKQRRPTIKGLKDFFYFSENIFYALKKSYYDKNKNPTCGLFYFDKLPGTLDIWWYNRKILYLVQYKICSPAFFSVSEH